MYFGKLMTCELLVIAPLSDGASYKKKAFYQIDQL